MEALQCARLLLTASESTLQDATMTDGLLDPFTAGVPAACEPEQGADDSVQHAGPFGVAPRFQGIHGPKAGFVSRGTRPSDEGGGVLDDAGHVTAYRRTFDNQFVVDRSSDERGQRRFASPTSAVWARLKIF